MWTIAAAAGCLAGLVLLLRQFRFLPDAPTRLLLLVLWARYVFQAFPEYTTPANYAGFSLNALAAIGSAGLMGLVLDRPLLRLPAMVPIFGFVAFTAMTAVMNGIVIGLINDVIKWSLLIGVALLIYRSALLFGLDATLRALLVVLATPLMLQGLSIALNQPKASDFDNSTNYIGGYLHEAVFSEVLLTFFAVVCLIRWRSASAGVLLSLIAVIGLIMANYRTSIVAALPTAALMGVSLALRPAGIKYRPPAVILLLLAAAALLPLALAAVPDRFSDIFRVLSDLGLVLKHPGEFTAAEREIFTGRILIWSIYLEAYSNGSLLQHLIGFGPNAWEGRFNLYAHNTFVSALYEFGSLGLMLLLTIFATNFWLAINLADRSLAMRLAAVQLSFFILNLATMPLWSIEGRIFYAILIGATWAASSAHVVRPAPAADGGPSEPTAAAEHPDGARHSRA